MAQDANLGTEAATRYLPEGNLGTKTMTKTFKNSLISGSLLNQGRCVYVHNESCSLGFISNPANKTQTVHISGVLRTLLGCFGNLNPHGKTQLLKCQVRFIFHFLLNFHLLP